MIVGKGYPYGVVTFGYGSKLPIQGNEYSEAVLFGASLDQIGIGSNNFIKSYLMEIYSEQFQSKQLGYGKEILLRSVPYLNRVPYWFWNRNLELDVGAEIENLGVVNFNPNFQFGVGCGTELSAGSSQYVNSSFETGAILTATKFEAIVNFLSLNASPCIPFVSLNRILSSASFRSRNTITNQDLWVRRQPRSPRTAVNNTSVGSFDWTNPQNIYISDNTYATFSGNNRRSRYLYGYNHNFDIPINARIIGIELRIERRASANSANSNIQDFSVRLYRPGVGWFGSDLRKTGRWTTVEGVSIYGGPTNLWGLTTVQATPAMINDPTFGFGLSVDVRGPAVASVDNYLTYIYYTTSILSHDVYREERIAGNLSSNSRWDSRANSGLSVRGSATPSTSHRMRGATVLSAQAFQEEFNIAMLVNSISMVISPAIEQLYGFRSPEVLILSVMGALARNSNHRSQDSLEMTSSGFIDASYNLSYIKSTLIRVLDIKQDEASQGVMDFITILTAALSLSMNNQIDIDSIIELIANNDYLSRGGANLEETLTMVIEALKVDTNTVGMNFIQVLSTTASYVKEVTREINSSIIMASQAIDLKQALLNLSSSLELSASPEQIQSAGFNVMGLLTLSSSAVDSHQTQIDILDFLSMDTLATSSEYSESSLIGTLNLTTQAEKLRESLIDYLCDLSLVSDVSTDQDKENQIDLGTSLSAQASDLLEFTMDFIDDYIESIQGLDEYSVLNLVLGMLELSTSASDIELGNLDIDVLLNLTAGVSESEFDRIAQDYQDDETLQVIAQMLADGDVIGVLNYGSQLYRAFARDRFYKSQSRERSLKVESRIRIFTVEDIKRFFNSLSRDRVLKSEDRDRSIPSEDRSRIDPASNKEREYDAQDRERAELSEEKRRIIIVEARERLKKSLDRDRIKKSEDRKRLID